jgi:hypothetical protein
VGSIPPFRLVTPDTSRPVGAFEGIALVFAGAIVKWMFDMQADRIRKADEVDQGLVAEEKKLRDKVAELDKTNSTAIATLTSGIDHIVRELSGIRGDMKENREVVFNRLDRNEREIVEVKALVAQSSQQLRAIETKLSEGCGK